MTFARSLEDDGLLDLGEEKKEGKWEGGCLSPKGKMAYAVHKKRKEYIENLKLLNNARCSANSYPTGSLSLASVLFKCLFYPGI